MWPLTTINNQPQICCHHPRPTTTMNNFAATSHNFTTTTTTQPGIISTPPPKTTNNQPLFHCHHLWPTIVKLRLPINSNSLATTLLAITNSELYFVTTTHPAESQEQSKFICHYPPNTKKFSFSESMKGFHAQFTYFAKFQSIGTKFVDICKFPNIHV